MRDNKLFVNIYGNVGTLVQDTSSAMATIIKVFCNNTYREILRRLNWDVINNSYTISVVAGTQDYILPSDFGKEVYVNDSTNKLAIPFIDFQTLAEKYADTLASTGDVSRYTIFNDTIRTQPSSASTISFVSSSTADVTQSVRVKGIDANGVEIEETITLNGTTASPTTNSYTKVRNISKSATTTGTVTGTSNSGAVTVAVLAPADLVHQVVKMRLHYIPADALTLAVPYHINPYPLSNDYDFPVIDCADGIELGATAQAWRYKRQMSKAQEYERLFEKWLMDAAWEIENQPNQTHLINPKPYSREIV